MATRDRTELGILTSLVYVNGLALATGDDTAGGDGLADCGAATSDRTELGILTSLVYVNGLALATGDDMAGGDGLAGCGAATGEGTKGSCFTCVIEALLGDSVRSE